MTLRLAFALPLLLAGCSSSGLPLLGGGKAPEAAAGFREPYLAASGGSAAGGPTCKKLEEAKSRAEALIVLIRTRFGKSGAAQFGAGVIFAARGGQIGIVTAKHVVHQDRGGKASVEVAFAGEEGRYVPASVQPLKGGGPMSDLAVLQVDAKSVPPSLSARLQYAILRQQSDLFDIKDVAIIGNPGARGKLVTPPGPANLASSHELRVNSGVMEQGYSGGGAFDRQWRLVGIVYEDRGSFAAAYPIDPVLQLVRSSGHQIDLGPAPPSRKGVHLAQVSGEPADFRSSVMTAARDALQRGGYEPDCDMPDSYKLSLSVGVRPGSLTTTVAEIRSVFVGPTGAQLADERKQIHYQNVWGTAAAMESKMKPAMEEIVQKLTASMR